MRKNVNKRKGRHVGPWGQKRKKPNKLKGRTYTVSIAVPGSIISNAQSSELKAYLAGQVARAATIFNVDEVVVFTEDAAEIPSEDFKGAEKSDPNLFLARVLQYLECPAYMRNSLFEVHPDLKYADLLNPLDPPHHMKQEELSRYRDGVVVDKDTGEDESCFVDIGLGRFCKIDKKLEPGTRVTVRVFKKGEGSIDIKGAVVPRGTPRVRMRFPNWGYTVRLAKGLEGVIKNCPWSEGYDLTIGTSENGFDCQFKEFELEKFKHLMVVFGGVNGLENVVMESGEGEEKKLLTEPAKFFDLWLNTCKHQGSGTIRTEEAILVSLSLLSPHIRSNRF